MTTLEDFSAVLSNIYEAAVDHSRWDAALTSLVGAVGGTKGGHGLQSVADDLGVTLSTIRIHLQRVFEKTDTHRQAELVRLLLNLRPTLPP